MLTRSQQQELDRLESRHRKTQSRTAVRRLAAAAPAPVKPPEVHVHVTMPEQKTPPVTKSDPVIVPGPKKWVFDHRYDEHGRLVKTTATAQ